MSESLQYPLFGNKRAVIEAVERGAAAVDGLSQPTLGPVADTRTDYPYAEVLPESTDYQGGNEFVHTLRLNCYFERTRHNDDYLLMLATAFDAVKQAIQECLGVSCVLNARPQVIEDYAGNLNGTLLILVSAQLRVSTLVDMSDI